METVEESDSCDCSIYEPSLPTGQSWTSHGWDENILMQLCKKIRKKLNSGVLAKYLKKRQNKVLSEKLTLSKRNCFEKAQENPEVYFFK
jgi:hypothetical protein